MSTAKEAMAEIISQQLDDSSFDEIMRELAMARMVQRGLDDSDAGRIMDDSDVLRKIESCGPVLRARQTATRFHTKA
jgi:predicted transcriptional regulator